MRDVLAEDTGTTAVATSEPAPTAPQRPVLPYRPRAMLLYGALGLVLAAVVWVLAWTAVRLALLTMSLAAAVLLAALCTPLMRWLRRGLPGWLASTICLLLVVGVPSGTGFLVWHRVRSQLGELRTALTQGVDRIREWLIEGPLSLAPGRVYDVRDLVVTRLHEAVPSASVGAMTVLQVVAATALALFSLFFMLRDGDRLWRSLSQAFPRAHRHRVEVAGRQGWQTLSQYTRGVSVVAMVDAVAVGTALLVLDVPLYLSLTLLTFIAAFVPLVGAALSGLVAVLVTLVTNGATDSVVVAAVVLAVQQLEGNVLSPLVVGRAVRLHPLVIAVSVTAGIILAGVMGALVAVPLVAVVSSVMKSLAVIGPPSDDSQDDGSFSRF